MHYRTFCLLVAGILAAAATGKFVGNVTGRSIPPPAVSVQPTLAVDDVLPDVTLLSPSESARVRDLRGRYRTALVIFSAACGECFGEAIVWQELQDRYGSSVKLVGLAAKASSEDLARFRELVGVTFPLLHISIEAAMELGVSAYPTIYVTDVTRRILFARGGATATVELNGRNKDEGQGDQVEAADPRFPDSLIGQWVRVYPYGGGRDTLVLNPDGGTLGPATALDVDPMKRISQWAVGESGLCLADGVIWVCAGYELRGDTLAVANGDYTVLVRPRQVTTQSLALDSAANDDRSRFGTLPPSPKPARRPQG
jgi:peroxiredoxin